MTSYEELKALGIRYGARVTKHRAQMSYVHNGFHIRAWEIVKPRIEYNDIGPDIYGLHGFLRSIKRVEKEIDGYFIEEGEDGHYLYDISLSWEGIKNLYYGYWSTHNSYNIEPHISDNLDKACAVMARIARIESKGYECHWWILDKLNPDQSEHKRHVVAQGNVNTTKVG